MDNKPITIKKLTSHIKRRIKQGRCLGLLGFVENQALTPEVERLFTFYRFGVPVGYDWVNGNQRLQELIQSIEKEA